MQKFISKVSYFLLLIVAISVALTLLNRMFLLSIDSRNIDPKKNILVLGDSHSKYAVNDSILFNSANFSQDADSYFYTYYKLKYFLEANPQIDTVFVSFSRHNLHKSIEKRWLLSPEHLATRINLYLPLLEWKDFWFLARQIPGQTLSGFFTQIGSPSILAFRGSQIFGGFENLNQDNLEEELKALRLGELGEEYQSFEVSQLENSYLQRIVNYCEHKNVKLLLLGTPIHKALHDQCKTLTEFRDSNYSEVPFLDYRTLVLEDDCFSDLVHLSPKGSSLFSNILKKSKNTDP